MTILSNLEMAFASETALRLLLASFLGMVIGMERESHRKPAGMRTIMLICFGSALFTIISVRMGQMLNGNPTQIAAQLVSGIGFLGAGAILHARGAVVGLTTAATIFVVASIGMATGAGLYAVAVFSTVVALAALIILRWLEMRLKLWARTVTFSITTRELPDTITAVNRILDEEQLNMQQIRCSSAGETASLQFTLDVSDAMERKLLERLSHLRTSVSVGVSDGIASESS